MSVILEILFEFLFQVLIEIAVEIGLHNRKGLRRELHPVVSVLGYAVAGAVLGGLSLVVFPQLFLSHPYAQFAHLAVTPVLAGVVMGLLGAWRARRGSELVRLDRFAYGYVFALAFALARHGFAGSV